MTDDIKDPSPAELLRVHCETGEPLDESELASVVEAGLTTWEAWDDRGGGLFWLSEKWPEEDGE